MKYKKYKKVNKSKHETSPICGSSDILEVKPLWMICNTCESNFHAIPL